MVKVDYSRVVYGLNGTHACQSHWFTYRHFINCKGYNLETWEKVSEWGLLCPVTLIKNHTGFQQNQNCSQNLCSLPFLCTPSPLDLVLIKANGNDVLISNQKFSVGTKKNTNSVRTKITGGSSEMYVKETDPSLCNDSKSSKRQAVPLRDRKAYGTVDTWLYSFLTWR